MAYIGGCQCGRIRYRADEPRDRSSVCYCRMCQKASGGPFMAFVRFPANQVEWSTPPDVFASSNLVERGFCRNCGTPLSYRQIGGPHLILTINNLDAPAVAEPITEAAIEDAGRRRAECAVLGERARAEITPAQRPEPARRPAERDAGGRHHGRSVGNEIARRIADLGLRRRGERGESLRLRLVEADESGMGHGEVGIDIDPRRRTIAVGPLDAIALARTACRCIAGVAAEQKFGGLIEDEKADQRIQTRHDPGANAGLRPPRAYKQRRRAEFRGRISRAFRNGGPARIVAVEAHAGPEEQLSLVERP